MDRSGVKRWIYSQTAIVCNKKFKYANAIISEPPCT